MFIYYNIISILRKIKKIRFNTHVIIKNNKLNL